MTHGTDTTTEPVVETDHGSAITELALELGAQAEYRDVEGARIAARPEALRSIVHALGVDVESDADARQALREVRAARTSRLVDHVHVCWDGAATPVRLGGAASRSDASVRCTLTTEQGDVLELERGADGRVLLPSGLAFGYHDLDVMVGDTRETSRIISAPRLAQSGGLDRSWGVFLPLYAARSEGDWGIGDLGSARRLLELVDDAGGRLVGSTPLLATFLDEPFEPSPYAPVSRLFWNETYLDIDRLPELDASVTARALLRDRDVLRRREELRALNLVDHHAVHALKRRVFEACAVDLSGDRRAAFEAWCDSHELVAPYASFRARIEAAARGEATGSPAADHYHRYVQWSMEQQLADVASSTGAGLYLDLPIGVHPDGFDRSFHADLFAPGMSVGAPPDPLALDGQDWGLPPLHPERLRETGYDYQIASIRNLFRHASAVRIDHVMGMHRLFWIPSELDASAGVYVSYAAEELWAIVCLESHRTGCLVVGEDLGTVPPQVREAMTEHDARRTYVLQFELAPDEDAAIRPAPVGSLAAINTHDTPTWAAAWAALDDATRSAVVTYLRRAGVLEGEDAEGEDLGPEVTCAAALRLLARGDAGSVIASIEDLWGEPLPQNVPGTSSQQAPNWVRRTARTLEQVAADEQLLALLRELTSLRAASTPPHREVPVRHDVSLLTDEDLYLFAEGTHNRVHRVLGSHPHVADGVAGTWFAVWAPNAERVSVIGDFNGWTAGQHALASHPGGSGIWHGWIPAVGPGERYKYHIASRVDGYEVEKADPYARRAELPPKTASIVWSDAHEWRDDEWMASRAAHNGPDAPMSVYEVHPGSWIRVPEEGNRAPAWRELAPRLIEHVQRAGFTHVELMPVMEHPYYGSWGYQTTGYFAPTSRYGTPDDFRWFIDELHRAGIGVLLDWVPSHFPVDQHGLGFFDGTHLYEHADPRQGFHPDWKSWIFNYSRNEVRSFLLSSAMYWLEEFHVDGLRVDAVASMLYLDYSREDGEWIPNVHGGRENLEAIDLLRRLNTDAYGDFPGITMVAEESTAWGGVSRPTWTGGLGFGMKWDMGWMHDTLRYLAHEPIHRSHHQDELTFRQLYACTENFMLALSHDEVVHGKGSLLDRMPGDEWQKFANLRLLLAYMWMLPGKKLLFMGCEFAQGAEWSHEASLDWHLLERPQHAGVLELVSDLNRTYREMPALHEREFEHEGFSWVDTSDSEQCVLSWLRHARAEGEPPVLVVMNATPVLRTGYRVGVPVAGRWEEIVNSDAHAYWGGGHGNAAGVDADAEPAHGHGHSLALTLPPLAVIALRPVVDAGAAR